MITPTFLSKNDMIGLVAPARSIKQEEVQTAIELFKSWGLRVKQGSHLFKTDHQFAGTDEERAEDFQSMLDNQDIKAIFCARGGYGTIRTTEILNFAAFSKSPKWIIGYSDITVLHSYINEYLGIKTLHATMPLNITDETQNTPTTELLRKTLFGEILRFSWKSGHISQPFDSVSGTLTGGNLSVLYSLRGTKYEIDTRNKILFLEDLDEYLYHIDRMMMNLKTGGKLDQLKALVVGGMTDMNDNTKPYGKNAQDIILDVTKNYDYPVIFDCPVGHMKENLPMIMGGEVELRIATSRMVEIEFTD